MKKIMTMTCAALMLFACGMASGCKDELKAEEYVETNYPAPVAENAPEGVSFRFLLYPNFWYNRVNVYDVTCENGRLKTYWDDIFAEALTNFSHPTDPAPDRLFDQHASIYKAPDVELDGADTDKMEDWPYVDYIYAPGEDGELVDFVTVICYASEPTIDNEPEGIICFTVIKVEPKDMELTATVVKSVSYKHERRGFYVGQPYSRVKKEIAKTIRENR